MSYNVLSRPIELPEFMSIDQIARLLRRDTKFLYDIKLTAGVPSKLGGDGKRLYRWSEIKKRLERNNVMPPDDNHPYHEYTCREAANIIGVGRRRIYKWFASGRVEMHTRADGVTIVYRKDIEYILRNYDRTLLISRMNGPIRVTDMRTLMGLKKDQFNHTKKYIQPLPRTRRKPRLYDQATLHAYAMRGVDQCTRFRREPMPKYMNRTLSAIYLGVNADKMSHLIKSKKIVAHEVVRPTGKTIKLYYKPELDQLILDMQMVEAYSDGLPYYSKSAIEHKFGKTKRWIDEYITKTCRRVDFHGNILPAKTESDKNYYFMGWHRGDVEEAVRTCGDEHVTMYMRIADREREKERKRHAASMAKAKKARLAEREKEVAAKERALAKEKAAAAAEKKKLAAEAARIRERERKAAQPKVFYNPVDQIEAAIDAGFAARNAEHLQKVKESRAKAAEKTRLRNEINGLLNLTTSYADGGYSKWSRLPYSVTREIFTILFRRNGIRKQGGSLKYNLYPHEGDEYIINVNDRKAITRRQRADTSMPRLIAKGVAAIREKNLKFLPAWIVLAPATSYIPDTRFLELLRNVPEQFGAVAPYGYGYVMPDESHNKCPKTYGMYTMYHADSPNTEFVVGTEVGTMAQVAVMAGPFLAIRGEYMSALDELDFFTGLGECRSLVGPIVSAVCRRKRIPMGVISVNSVSCADYEIQPGSLEWNAVMDKIQRYMQK